MRRRSTAVTVVPGCVLLRSDWVVAVRVLVGRRCAVSIRSLRWISSLRTRRIRRRVSISRVRVAAIGSRIRSVSRLRRIWAICLRMLMRMLPMRLRCIRMWLARMSLQLGWIGMVRVLMSMGLGLILIVSRFRIAGSKVRGIGEGIGRGFCI